MSSKGDDNHLVDAAFTLLVVGGVLFVIFLIVVFVFHFIFSFLPLVIFYVLPFVGMSFLCGFIFSLSASMFTSRAVDFRWLSVSLPVISVILYALVGAPQTEYRYIVHEVAPAKVLKKPKEKEKPPETPKRTVETIIWTAPLSSDGLPHKVRSGLVASLSDFPSSNFSNSSGGRYPIPE